MITRIQTVYVPAADVGAASDFYEKAFGTRPRFRDRDRWVQFSLGDSGFAVASREEAAEGADSPVIVFEASEREDHDRFVAAGALLLAERDMGSHGRTRTYRVMGGHLVQLFWRSGS